MLKIRLLGKFEVRQGNEPLIIRSRPAQSLLAYLVLTAGTRHRREQLAGILWPDLDETRARSNLRQALWRLRESFDDSCLDADKIAIAFEPISDYWLDVSILCGVAGGESSTEELLQASGVYGGQLLPGFYDEWIIHERERLESVFNQIMRTLCNRLSSEEKWPDVIEQAERWLAVGGISEPAFRALITAHNALGDMAGVTAAYQRCIKLLGDELGLEPSPETRSLYDSVLTRVEYTSVGPDKSPEPAQSHSLPVNLSTFIGRDADIAEIEALLAEPTTRLLTLLGAGGIGKTRLAIQVGFRALDKYADGIGWVELAPQHDAESVPQAVTAALGLREKVGHSWLSILLNHLKPKRLLLILDNCEHLSAACSQFADTLLRACPNLQILATSRETFGITGELNYQVRPLSMPDPQGKSNGQALANFEAVRLFAERAKYAFDGFSITEENAPTIALVCARLDGMPLAIELAAARMKTLSVTQLAERLDDRFHLLTGGSRTALPRQQTLRATIDWSYDPLTEGDKKLFARLGVFVGGWTLEVAETVCGRELPFAVLDGLQSLLDKNLIRQVSGSGGEMRFDMLETIREYAVEKLDQSGEGDAIRMAHATAFLAIAEQSESGLAGPTFEQWRPRMTEEDDNLRAALRFCLETGHIEVALRMAAALKRTWWQHGQYTEARRWLEEALAADGKASPAVRAKALVSCGNMICMLEDYRQGLPLLYEGLEMYRAIGDDPGVAEGLFQLAESLWLYGETDEAVLMFEESLKIFRQLNNGRRIAFCLIMLANIASGTGQFTRSRSLWEECDAVVQGLGDKSMTAIYHLHFANLPMREGLYAQALTHLEIATTLFREIGWQELLGGTLANLALTTQRLGDLVRASTLICESCQIILPFGITRMLTRLLEIKAAIEVAQGAPLNAARMFGAAEARRESIHVPLIPADALIFEKDIAAGRSLVDEAAWAAAWKAGREMSPEDALHDAI